MLIEHGEFIENFNYPKWQQMVNAGRLDGANVLVPEEGEKENNIDEE